MRSFFPVYVQLPFFISIVRTDDIQKRRLTRTALALDRYKFVVIEFEVDTADTYCEYIVAVVYLSDVFKF